jgi:AcrR family transcriptional regulator
MSSRTSDDAPVTVTTDAPVRAQIVEAALEILRTQGHVGLTVRRVAARAGCSTIGVYTWFGGKDGLVDALLLDGFRSFATALSRARPGRGPFARLLAQGRAYRAWALANPTTYEVMFMRAVPGHVPGDEARLAAYAAYGLLRSAIVESQASGEMRDLDADAAAMAIWGVAHGLVSLEIAQAQPDSVGVDPSLHQRSYTLALRLITDGLRRERG